MIIDKLNSYNVDKHNSSNLIPKTFTLARVKVLGTRLIIVVLVVFVFTMVWLLCKFEIKQNNLCLYVNAVIIT